jgi:hypothetical protein
MSQSSEINCCICLDPLNVHRPIIGKRATSKKLEVVRTPCLHKFHLECITNWLRRSRTRNCPLCKTNIKESQLVPAEDEAMEVDSADEEVPAVEANEAGDATGGISSEEEEESSSDDEEVSESEPEQIELEDASDSEED